MSDGAVTLNPRTAGPLDGEGMGTAELETQLEQHHQAAFGWALSCCLWDRADAEDVLQTSYLKILDGRAVFAGRSSFRTWLFGVIRRTAAEHRRRRALHRWLPLVGLPDGADPGAGVLRSEATSRLTVALGALSPRQREVLHLVFYQDLTIEEAAEAMAVSLGAARTHYQRGKQRLRTLLREPGEA